ncbi:MAG: N utilization substance protein B [Candidatus Parcubacteria bacterium]|nr:MAG: N utilization substance protein B [Candidatus Parcubacteria bacterium]
MSTRHLCRIIVLQSLYEWSFWGQPAEKWKEIFYKNLKEFGNDIDEVDFAEKLIKGVVENINFLDEIIKRNTKHWPYEQIPLLEKNILRIAIYEIYFQNHNEVPLKVSINEAIILAKSFISDISAKFINGVLGSVYEEYVNSKESIKS